MRQRGFMVFSVGVRERRVRSGLHAVGKRDFEDDATLGRSERSVYFAWWAACVISRFQPLLERGIIEAARDDENLFGITVRLPSERSRVRAGQEPRQTRVLASRVIDAQRHFFGDALQTGHRGPSGMVIGCE